jgi:hypothetical protein
MVYDALKLQLTAADREQLQAETRNPGPASHWLVALLTTSHDSRHALMTRKKNPHRGRAGRGYFLGGEGWGRPSRIRLSRPLSWATDLF